MQAGRLNRRFKLQRPSTATDELGQPIPGWEDVATVWADIRHKSGLETIKAGAVVSIVPASVRIRFRTDVTAGWRGIEGSTPYEIKAPMPDVSGREFLDLACEVVS